MVKSVFVLGSFSETRKNKKNKWHFWSCSKKILVQVNNFQEVPFVQHFRDTFDRFFYTAVLSCQRKGTFWKLLTHVIAKVFVNNFESLFCLPYPPGGAIIQKNQKQISKSWYLQYWRAPRGVRGVNIFGRTPLTIFWWFGALILSPNWGIFEKV